LRTSASFARFVLLAAIGLLKLSSCEALTGLDACTESPSDVRVNQRGDVDEFVGHPQAAALLDNGRVMVAFSAQNVNGPAAQQATGEIRIAMMDVAKGSPLTLCDTFDVDRTISDPAEFSFGASVSRAEANVEGRPAAALVSWTQGRPGSSEIRLRFIDQAGCPLGLSFRPRAGGFAASLAWSAQRRAVLLTGQDGRDVFLSWIDVPGPAESVTIARGRGLLGGFANSAVAGDGSAFVVWTDDGQPRGVLLDPTGKPRPTLGSSERAADFALELPVQLEEFGAPPSVTVSAGSDRYVVAVEANLPGARSILRSTIREYSLDGRPLGQAREIDPGDPDLQASLSLVHAPAASLVAVWQSRSAQGTVGRLLGYGGSERWNSIDCDIGRFSLGTRTPLLVGWPSALFADGRVIVFHNAEGGSDPRGSGVYLWQMPFSRLWPGPN
jgi:hypothetical protein